VGALALSRRGDVWAEPAAAIEGLPAAPAAGRPMHDVVLAAVEGTLRSMPAGKRRDLNVVEDAVRRAVRAAVNEAWGKKPICHVLISAVDVRS
jgi:ribonuclease J